MNPSSPNHFKSNPTKTGLYLLLPVIFLFISGTLYAINVIRDHQPVVSNNLALDDGPIAICNDTTVYLDVSGVVFIDPSFVDGGSTGDEGIVFMEVVPSQFSCTDIGVNATILTVTDSLGFTDQCIVNVTVIDNIAPTVICQSITVVPDFTGVATIIPADIDGGSSDNCEIAYMTVVPDTFTSANLGDNQVVLTVTDVSGNSTTCNAIVTVDDNFGDILCNNAEIYLDPGGLASVSPNDLIGPPSLVDASDTIIISKSEFNCEDVGVNTVITTLTDTLGFTYQCASNVTVIDNLLPTVACLSITVVPDFTGVATIIPADIDGGSSDNCEIAYMTVVPDTFTSADLGDNQVVLTVTDVSGNSTTCNAVVTLDVLDAINESEFMDFSFYPNPNNGSFSIRTQGIGNEYLLEIMEVTGKTVYSEKLELSANNFQTVNVHQLKAGVYLIKLIDTAENHSRTLRMVIN